MNRRGFFGACAAVVAAPFVPPVALPQVGCWTLTFKDPITVAGPYSMHGWYGNRIIYSEEHRWESGITWDSGHKV